MAKYFGCVLVQRVVFPAFLAACEYLLFGLLNIPLEYAGSYPDLIIHIMVQQLIAIRMKAKSLDRVNAGQIEIFRHILKNFY